MITVELTYDMGKALGVDTFEIDDVARVADVVAATRARFGDKAEDFEKLTRVAAVAVNGVPVNYRMASKPALVPGDTVACVKAAAGG